MTLQMQDNSFVSEPSTRVQLGKVPNWLRQHLLKAFGRTPNWGSTNGLALLWHWLPQHCPSNHWLVQYGSAIVNDVSAFVCEPFCSADSDFSELQQFAEKIGCQFIVDEKSYWMPGKTIRLAFVPKHNEVRDKQQDSLALAC